MPSVRSLSARAAAWTPPLALAWWVVTEGRPGSWGLGVPTVLAPAVIAALAFPPPRRWPRPLALLRFAGFFAEQSLRGGWDVARRAFSPAMPLAPGFAELILTAPPSLALASTGLPAAAPPCRGARSVTASA